VILVAFACGDPLRREELDCEEAVAYLQHCCPGFSGNDFRCLYDPGCDSSTVPDIGESESACIRGESCAQLQESGVCTRAVAPKDLACP
jgi:hypothetical protein